MASEAVVGVIGGSGFYSLLDDAVEHFVDTPFGPPSAPITMGTLAGRRVAFLPRHGVDHRFAPHLVPYRANLWALSALGVQQVLSLSAVGSLTADLPPGSLVVPDQLADRTSGRRHTYFDTGDGVNHANFADPYCRELRAAAVGAASDVVDGGTLVVVNGPRFSTRAESVEFQSNGWRVIGMTALPEAALARELGLCYATLALVTDLDAGVEAGEGVSHEDVLAAFAANVPRLREMLVATVGRLSEERGPCGCPSAIVNAMPDSRREIVHDQTGVRVEFDGPLAVIVLDSPPLNLFNAAMMTGLRTAVREVAASDARALLIRAEGRAVSAGVDVNLFATLNAHTGAELWRDWFDVVHEIEELPIPTVFAAHALCLTAAFEISLACDLLLAAESARFGLIEMVVGLTPSMGGPQRLASRAGPARARELVYSGELYDAATLERWNVVNRVLPDAGFADAARAFANRLAQGPTRAHAATKRIVREQVEQGVRAADYLTSSVSGALFATTDLTNAVATFLREGPGKATFDGR